MLPAAFQTPRALRWLNIPAVGFSLAASVVGCTVGMFKMFDDLDGGAWIAGYSAGIPTVLVGALWAWLLRIPGTVGQSRLRWGWLASFPLAALNAALSAAYFQVSGSWSGAWMLLEKMLEAAVVGMTFGAILWIPALAATLLVFGLPIARAQSLAREGLSGEERGERIVGLTCAGMSLLGMGVVLFVGYPSRWAFSGGYPLAWPFAGFGVPGLALGVAAAALARSREARRRAFVARAEAGQLPGYRVDPNAEGKVLVRVSSQGDGYRKADFQEEIFELDQEGRATHARRAGQ